MLPHLGRQIDHLISNRIHHIDLHPGNVLVGADDRLVLIDFDKASISPHHRGNLAERYLRRWVRSIIKHRLPEALNVGLCRAMRSPALWSLATLAGLFSGEINPLPPEPSGT